MKLMSINPAYQWHWKKFSQLSVFELYEILKIRQTVFVVEQQCIYQDADDLDSHSWHLFFKSSDAQNEQQIIAYLRVVLPNYKYAEPAIGRVLVTHDARGQGVGKLLTEKALQLLRSEFPKQAVRISAQQHLLDFYSQLGFNVVSEPYDEDGIMHVEMLIESV